MQNRTYLRGGWCLKRNGESGLGYWINIKLDDLVSQNVIDNN